MLGLSLLVHLALLVLAVPHLVPDPSDVEVGNPVTEPDELVVEAVYEDPVEQEQAEPEPDDDPEIAEPEPIEQPDEEEPEPVEQIESVALDKKIVDQVTNEENPEDASFLSDQANRVEEETRAEETTTDDVDPSNETVEESGEPPPELAARVEPTPARPRPTPPEPSPRDPQPSEVEPNEIEGSDPVIVQKREKVPPRRTFIPDMQAYEQVFAERDETVREHAESHSQGKKLFENWEENDARVRASLENFIHEVRPGNHTGVNAHKSVFASYLGSIHRKIHVRWANNYLMDLDLHERRGSPLNDPRLNTKLEFVITADSGEVESVNIVSSSGEVRFDAQAVSIAYRIGPHPNPPPEIVSPDGKIYIHWNFWRDQRQCGTFGASVFIVNEDQRSSPG